MEQENGLHVADDTSLYCTFSASGPRPVFQPIFICHTCCGNETVNCICEACASKCHSSHDVRYLTIGASYCDCRQLSGDHSCGLKSKSDNAAKYLGIEPAKCFPSSYPMHGLYDTMLYRLPELVIPSSELCKAIRKEALSLVSQTKDTFWVAGRLDTGASWLERLAFCILNRHRHSLPCSETCGAEWWVQVKDSSDCNDVLKEIDMHYDKDETLATHFNLASFPSISTVTYLSEENGGFPTIVSSKTYEEPLETAIKRFVISSPRCGNHLVFDGRLLHGVPFRPAFVEEEKRPTQARITFLVNIWQTAPAGVTALPETIREAFNGSLNDKLSPSFRKLRFHTNNIDTVFVPKQRTDHNVIRLPITGQSGSDDKNDSWSIHLPSDFSQSNDCSLVEL